MKHANLLEHRLPRPIGNKPVKQTNNVAAGDSPDINRIEFILPRGLCNHLNNRANMQVNTLVINLAPALTFRCLHSETCEAKER